MKLIHNYINNVYNFPGLFIKIWLEKPISLHHSFKNCVPVIFLTLCFSSLRLLNSFKLINKLSLHV